MKMKTAEIIKKYRAERELTQTQFADALNDAVAGAEFVRQNVSQWENGEVKPGYFFVLSLFMCCSGWRNRMALELLKVMKPELYE
jgi:DNA-binding XRE family transcriptional regulator